MKARIVGYSRDHKGKICGYHLKDTANTIHCSSGTYGNTAQYIININKKNMEEKIFRIRKLTERECWRLMDVDDKYIDKLLAAKDEKGKRLISKTQCYKLAGNSIVVSCMYGIFKNLFIETTPKKPVQLSLFDFI